MKSSKIENIFDYDPPLEEGEALSPLPYYQPFQSNFDPELALPRANSPTRQNPFQMTRWSEGADKPQGDVHASGGDILGSWGLARGGSCPRPSFPPGASTSSWGEPEARSLCNSTWVSPGPSKPPLSAYEESLGSRRPMTGVGMNSYFPEKNERGSSLLGLGFGSLDGPPFRTVASMGQTAAQTTAQTTSFDGNLSHYPWMLRPLGRSLSQNVYKTGHVRPMVCNFCKNNKEVPDIYLNHYLYHPETKVLSCPVLRKHVCEICGGTGDQAHTLQYCPVNRERGLQSKVPVLLKTRTITNSTGKIRRN